MDMPASVRNPFRKCQRERHAEAVDATLRIKFVTAVVLFFGNLAVETD